jgi:hypothetical protein
VYYACIRVRGEQNKMTKEELFKLFNEVDSINKQIAKLQASRDVLTIKAIRDYPFMDYPHFEQAYLKWEREIKS